MIVKYQNGQQGEPSVMEFGECMIYKERVIKRCKKMSEEKRNLIISNVLQVLKIYDVTDDYEKCVCKKCGATDRVIRYGKDQTGKQRYHCKRCGIYFTERSYSVISHCHCDASQIKKIVECMFNGYSLQQSSEVCGVSVGIVFRVKNKILSELQDDQLERIIAKANL